MVDQYLLALLDEARFDVENNINDDFYEREFIDYLNLKYNFIVDRLEREKNSYLTLVKIAEVLSCK